MNIINIFIGIISINLQIIKIENNYDEVTIMYIPILKNRQQELTVIKNMNSFFGSSIIPLIEVIKDEYKPNYKRDENGEFIYEKKKKKRMRVKDKPTDQDIITLDKIQKLLNGKKAFIDFFRFSDTEYDNKIYNGVETSLKLRAFDYYRKRLLEIGNHPFLVPVISIKENFTLSDYDLVKLINDLKKDNSSIAIRLTDEFLGKYYELLQNNLSENDYIMLDIREQNVDSKFMELDEFRDLETDAKKILLNSPRLRKMNNGKYENLQFTDKINNKVAEIYKDYELDGFGDFGGLKDDLPVDGGKNIGAALALIYFKDENAFFSIVNYDTNLGFYGFEYIKNEIFKRLDFFDKDNDCLAIQKIKTMNGNGNWKTWITITLTRYIHQQAKRLQEEIKK